MKIEITATEYLTKIGGVPVRLWKGVTEKGIECNVFVHRVAVHKDLKADEFEKELKEQLLPDHHVDLRQII